MQKNQILTEVILGKFHQIFNPFSQQCQCFGLFVGFFCLFVLVVGTCVCVYSMCPVV